jgi:membrane fusion protein, multidrug efflux system
VTAERDHKLLPIGSVSQQTVDDADAAERSAAAKVKADQAAVETARINLGYTRVASPISGTASQQQVTQGALVGSATSDTGSGGTLLTTVERIDPLYVNFTISAADLLTLRQARNVALAHQSDTKVQITLPNGSPYAEAGALDFSDVAANPITGAVNLRALVPNPKHDLLPGMYVTLEDHARRAKPRVPDPAAGGATRHRRRLCAGGGAAQQGAAQGCHHQREQRQRLDRHRRPR